MVEVNRRYFPKVMLDNDEVFLAQFEGVVSSVDEFSCVEISKTPDSYHFRIATSLPKYNIPLLEEILKLCNLYKIKLELSKSIKTSGTLSFDITI